MPRKSVEATCDDGRPGVDECISHEQKLQKRRKLTVCCDPLRDLVEITLQGSRSFLSCKRIGLRSKSLEGALIVVCSIYLWPDACDQFAHFLESVQEVLHLVDLCKGLPSVISTLLASYLED